MNNSITNIELILEELRNESEHRDKIKIIADYITELNRQHELEMEAEYDYDYVVEEFEDKAEPKTICESTTYSCERSLDSAIKSLWNWITSWF
jgi:hypothetical protein